MNDDAVSARKYRNAFLAFTAALVVFRLWFMTRFPLSGDESYHWEWSRNLAWGYHDHPGLTAYLIRGSTLLFGGSTPFSVRFPALVLLAAAALVVHALAGRAARDAGLDRLASARAAFLAGLIMLVAPVYAVFSVYISTDPPLIFFWALTLYLLYEALDRTSWAPWMAVGVAGGLAMLSKFLAFLLLAAFFLFLVFSPKYRRWFRAPQPYAAAVVALLVFSPFLWWNARHGWATFVFNFVSRHQAATGIYHLAEFLASQAVALSPGIFLFGVATLAGRTRRLPRLRDSRLGLLVYASLVPLAYFLYVSLRRQVGAHWPAAGWIGVLVLAACAWAGASPVPAGRRSGLAHPRFRRVSLAVAVVLFALAHLVVLLPDTLRRVEWSYRASPDRISTSKLAELYGWDEAGRRVAGIRAEMIAAQKEEPDGERGVFILGNQYGLSSNLAFYIPGQPRTHLWRAGKTAGENYRMWDDFPALGGQDAVFVSKRPDRLLREKERMLAHFSHVDEMETLDIVRDGRYIRSFYFIRAFRFNGLEPEFPDFEY